MPRGPRTVIMRPRGSTVHMRRRILGAGLSNSFSSGVGGGASGSNMLRFYTDDAPGPKIRPQVVIVMSFCFIGFDTALHIFSSSIATNLDLVPDTHGCSVHMFGSPNSKQLV
ncbi:protein transport protein Sec61 subunit beta-like [Olea europaea var. sylvestris]|uniref:Transport Sec61 subunit beta-like n=1 Tax=Olea europaea subsp. europaea TaxID=158383 RepID=A0A8S0RTE0_OLEEU|nr:protein transport protein Sec61 subunit beta-like [Olea europaea var. sylvestris]CAA2982765.1 transport Sec61 subunit beta-like [Olea europaea subsp. europaea]